MKLVKISIVALSMGLFLASCGGNSTETAPAADTTTPAVEEVAPAAPATTDSAAAAPATTDTTAAPAAAAPAAH